jgi:hypothetical protein
MLVVIACVAAWQVAIVLTVDELIPEIFRIVFRGIAKFLPVLYSHNLFACVDSPLSHGLLQQVKSKPRAVGELRNKSCHDFGSGRRECNADQGSHDRSAKSDDVCLIGEDIKGIDVIAFLSYPAEVDFDASSVEPLDE